MHGIFQWKTLFIGSAKWDRLRVCKGQCHVPCVLTILASIFFSLQSILNLLHLGQVFTFVIFHRLFCGYISLRASISIRNVQQGESSFAQHKTEIKSLNLLFKQLLRWIFVKRCNVNTRIFWHRFLSGIVCLFSEFYKRSYCNQK